MSEAFDGTVTIAATAGGSPVISLNGGTGDVTLGGASRDGDLVLRDSAGEDRVLIDAQNGLLILRDGNGHDSVTLDARFGLLDLGANGNEGDLRIRDNAGTFVFRFDANFAVLDIGGQGNEGDIRLYDGAGEVSIQLDGGSGDIRLSGADVAEEFQGAGDIEPGSLVVALGPDEVATTTRERDRRVIGVASGAGSLRPGIRLGSRPGGSRVPVTVMGRAYCKVDATFGAVGVGDLLTSSTRAGTRCGWATTRLPPGPSSASHSPCSTAAPACSRCCSPLGRRRRWPLLASVGSPPLACGCAGTSP